MSGLKDLQMLCRPEPEDYSRKIRFRSRFCLQKCLILTELLQPFDCVFSKYILRYQSAPAAGEMWEQDEIALKCPSKKLLASCSSESEVHSELSFRFRTSDFRSSKLERFHLLPGFAPASACKLKHLLCLQTWTTFCPNYSDRNTVQCAHCATRSTSWMASCHICLNKIQTYRFGEKFRFSIYLRQAFELRNEVEIDNETQEGLPTKLNSIPD